MQRAAGRCNMREIAHGFGWSRVRNSTDRLCTAAGLVPRRDLVLVLGMALALASVPAVLSQATLGSAGQGSIRQPFPGQPGVDPSGLGDYDSVMMQRRVRALNMERQKEMVSDTNKLLKLARELNVEVAAQKSDALTADQLRKIAEIEKLARNVRERMSTGVGESQSLMPPPGITYPVR
jgi:hypothetical protein